MFSSIDSRTIKLEGVFSRAFKHPLHAAAALSLLLHAVLLLCVFSPPHVPGKFNLSYIQVDLGTAGVMKSGGGAPDVDPLQTDVHPAPSQSEPVLHNPSSETVSQTITPQLQHARGNNAALSSENNSSPSGLSIVRELPIPSPGRRPTWSYQGPTLANAQAAYQAQLRRQAVSNLQNQAAAARGQYEMYLKSALLKVPVKSYCKVTLPVEGEAMVECETASDLARVYAEIDRFGSVPGVPGVSSPSEIEIYPPGHYGDVAASD